MDDKIAGLIDDDDVFVLVDDAERNGFGRGLAGSGGGTSMTIAAPELTRWLGSRIVLPSRRTAPASISALIRDRDKAAT